MCLIAQKAAAHFIDTEMPWTVRMADSVKMSMWLYETVLSKKSRLRVVTFPKYSWLTCRAVPMAEEQPYRSITNILAQTGGLKSMARVLGASETQAASSAEALIPAIVNTSSRLRGRRWVSKGREAD